MPEDGFFTGGTGFSEDEEERGASGSVHSLVPYPAAAVASGASEVADPPRTPPSPTTPAVPR